MAADEPMSDAPVDSPLEQSPVVVSVMSLDEDYDRFKCCKRRKSILTFLGGTLMLLLGLSGLAYVLHDYLAAVGVKQLVKDGSSGEDKKAEEAALILRKNNDAYFLQLRHAVIQYVYNGSYDPYIFLKPNSAQKLAMEWMSYTDTLHLRLPNNVTIDDNNSTQQKSDQAPDMLLESSQRHRWVQRFVLMTLFYENAGYTWVFDTSAKNVTVEGVDTNSTGTPWSEQVGVHECLWEFIDCNEQDHITALNLGGSSVTMIGTLPKELGLLTELRRLFLSHNRLKGSLPLEFYELTNLETLDLSFNKFSAKIHDRIGLFANLSQFTISENTFSGMFPPSVGKLTNMQHFEMSLNTQLGGSIMDSVVHWQGLTDLDVSETIVSGTIPTEFGTLSKLTNMNIWDVKLSGTLPTEVGNLVAMERTLMGKPNLVGTLPTEIGHWTNLQFFFITEGTFTGSIPTEIGAWTDCSTFIVKGTRELSGTLATELGLMTSLQVFQVYETHVSGTIPSEIGELKNAFELMFQSTDLTGTMPKEICELELKDLLANCQQLKEGVPAQVDCPKGCCTGCSLF